MRGGPFEPTKQQRDMVEALVGYGVRYTEICRLVVNPRTGKPIDTKTLMKAFRSELDVGATKANAKVAESLFKQATGGNVAALIWWTKCRMGWKEPPAAVELSGRVDSTMEVIHARQRVTRKLDSIAERIAAELLAWLPPQERSRFLKNLSDKDFEALEFDWSFWGRRNQIEPAGDWSVWLMLAGRGFGKTRSGAEWLRAQVCGATPLGCGHCRHVALVAETAADARDVMVGEGRSDDAAAGLLQVHPRDFRPIYEPSKRRLTWPNGAIASIYNATEPDQLRGPSHDAAWCDELAKWRYCQETWDNLEFGLRAGDHPRIVVTTTPKPIRTLKEIIADPGTVVTGGSTYENIGNLSPKFIDRVVRRYEGTRLGRQELGAEMLEDVVGALWSRSRIDELRIKPEAVPPLRRIVIAIDPAVTSGEDADETGIIAAGLGANGHGYVLEDASGVFAPNDWAREAIALYRARRADRIVAEVNNGGDLVEAALRVVDANIPFTPVHASRGKVIRAEPISALYEQGRVHHVGAFPILEDQMCAFTSDFDRVRAGYSPDRMDALVWALTELAVSDSSAEEWIAWAADLAARSRGMPPRVEMPNRPGQPAEPDGDLMAIYRSVEKKLMAPQYICAKCAGPIENTRVSDGVNAWHVWCAR